MAGHEEWISVTRAVALTGASERSVRRWVEEGTVTTRLETRGRRQVRLLRRDSLPDGDTKEPAEAPEVAGGDAPQPDLYQALLARHEVACVRLGYLEHAGEQMRALEANASSLVEAKVRAEAEAEQLRERVAQLEARRWWRWWTRC